MCPYTVAWPTCPRCGNVCIEPAAPRRERQCDEARARGPNVFCVRVAENTEDIKVRGRLNDCIDCASDLSTFKWGLDKGSDDTGDCWSGDVKDFDSLNPFVGVGGDADHGHNPRGFGAVRDLDDSVSVAKFKPPHPVDRAGLGAHIEDSGEADRVAEELERRIKARLIGTIKNENINHPNKFYSSSSEDEEVKLNISGDEKHKAAPISRRGGPRKTVPPMTERQRAIMRQTFAAIRRKGADLKYSSIEKLPQKDKYDTWVGLFDFGRAWDDGQPGSFREGAPLLQKKNQKPELANRGETWDDSRASS